jgi:hypothetical protein
MKNKNKMINTTKLVIVTSSDVDQSVETAIAECCSKQLFFHKDDSEFNVKLKKLMCLYLTCSGI